MGVRGLTTYIGENSQVYLKPHELHNCYLVVDGNSIACQLYKWQSKSDSIFGGDYDEFYKIVKDFFSLLKRCKVTPIVLIDGGYEKKKLKTVLSRARSKLPLLRSFARGYSAAVLFPLFLRETFAEAMMDLGIFCIQCNLEADVEIAAVARALNCPVLSYDSDFYIYDVLYIPFSSLYLEPVQFHDSNSYYIKCSLYDVTNLLKEFPGLDKSMLPILSTLLGNDYIDSALFHKFFDHIIIQNSKYKSFTQRKIHGVLHWLKKETVESAVKLILLHMGNKYESKILRAIQASIDDYSSTLVSGSVIDKLTSQLSSIGLDKRDLRMCLPPEIIQLYSQCRIHKLVADMINFGTYFTQLQVENVFNVSSYIHFLPLIRDIYAILTPYLADQDKPLKLYLVIGNNYTDITVDDDPTSYLKEINLCNVIKESREERLKLLYKIVGIEKDALEVVSENNWSVFIMSFIYWVRKLNNLISLAHIHALILTAIANEAVQKYVGYYRNALKFMKNKRSLINNLKTTPIATENCTEFEEMLKSVTLYEKLLIQKALIPYRQTMEMGKGRAFCMSTIHLFGCFQTCLFHIMQINALLKYPLPHLKIGDFYSGTLLFNFYLLIKGKPQVEQFGCDLFKDTPNLARIYFHLSKSLCKYSEKPIVVFNEEKVKKKKKKKRTNLKSVVLEEIFPDKADNDCEDEDEYFDEQNKYATLKNF